MDIARQTTRDRRASRARPGNHRARIASTPDTIDDPLTVELQSDPAGIRYELRDWTPRGTSLPVTGDTAIVIVDDTGRMHALINAPA